VGRGYERHRRVEGARRFVAWGRERYHTPFDDLAQPLDHGAIEQHATVLLAFVERVADTLIEPQWLPGAPWIGERLRTLAEDDERRRRPPSRWGSCSRRCLAAATMAAQPSGKIRIKGSDTMLLLVRQWAEAFMATHPGVAVEVDGGGTTTGIRALTLMLSRGKLLPEDGGSASAPRADVPAQARDALRRAA
jgi:hypothetical protein